MKKIILDTDIGFDCDDAGALALLHRLCDREEAELLAVTACYDSPYVAGCIDAINRYYKRTVPVGVFTMLKRPWTTIRSIPLPYAGIFPTVIRQKHILVPRIL